MPTRKRSSGSFGMQLKNLIPGWQAASKLRGGFDITLLTLVLILLSLGLLMVLSSSYPRAYSQALASESGSALDSRLYRKSKAEAICNNTYFHKFTSLRILSTDRNCLSKRELRRGSS